MRVTYVKLQGHGFVPGVGNVKDTLVEVKNASGSIKSLTMTLGNGVIDMLFNGKVNFAIPLANVQGYAFERDETKK